jgi:ribose-phosphate pyrophosphokinase
MTGNYPFPGTLCSSPLEDTTLLRWPKLVCPGCLDGEIVAPPRDRSLFYSTPGNDDDRGPLILATCRSGTAMGDRIIRHSSVLSSLIDNLSSCSYLPNMDFSFSDGETCARLEEEVKDGDVYLLQALCDPTSSRSVDQNYIAFLIAARAMKEWGARTVTGVLPYLAYARQNKATPMLREPITARLMADLTKSAGIDHLIVFHPHVEQIGGFYQGISVDHLDPARIFTRVFARFSRFEDTILIAPDAGAARYVMELGRALELHVAVTSKYRPCAERAEITEIIGDFTGKRRAIILDDMISTGGTIARLVKKLVEEHGIQEVYLGLSHNLCMQAALDRLEELHAVYNLAEVYVTNSIPQTEEFLKLPYLKVIDLSGLLALAIHVVHADRPSDLLLRTDEMIDRAFVQPPG